MKTFQPRNDKACDCDDRIVFIAKEGERVKKIEIYR
jgi:hypothetical protein